MDPNQQQLLLTGGGKKSTYIDDVFSTTVYKGNAGAQTGLGPNVDLTEGGLAWVKRREATEQNYLFDSLRNAGAITPSIYSNGHYAQDNRQWNLTFNNNGLAFNDSDTGINASGSKYVNYNFRKAEGFFDLVSWAGNNNNRTIAHNLGCVPGAIFIKCIDNGQSWACYFAKGNSTDPLKPADHYYKWNSTDAGTDSANYWQDTEPTDTHFSIGGDGAVNEAGYNYVAYLWAGGTVQGNASTYFTNRGALWYGTSTNTTYDFTLSTYNFTRECWFKASTPGGYSNAYRRIDNFLGAWSSNSHSIIWDHSSQPNRMSFFVYNFNSSGSTPLLKSSVKAYDNDGQWHHVAVTRSGDTFKMYLDGTLEDTATWSGSVDSGVASYMQIGGTIANSADEYWNGNISNYRLVRGASASSSTAVIYTDNFTPSTSPLTTTSQGAVESEIKFLGCNDIGYVGCTRTPIPVRSYSNTDSVNLPQGSSDSPFASSTALDKSAIFGNNGDQPIIKCGSYCGNNDWNNIDLGFQPQWVMIKNISDNGNDWNLYDSFRGIVDQSGNQSTVNASEKVLFPNLSNAEDTKNYLQLSMNGFTLRSSDSETNSANSKYAYIAIRRTDPLVAKPPEAGTDVFNVVLSPNNSNAPLYTSNFPVDWTWQKAQGVSHWYTGARQTGDEFLKTDSNAAKGNMGVTYQTFDYNNGWWDGAVTSQNDYISHMWKRGAGFDVVPFQATADNPYLKGYRHFLGQVPELKIIKRRQANEDWVVGGSVIAGDANTRDWTMRLDENYARTNTSNYWDGVDTATHFTVRSGNGAAGGASSDFIALLYASVSGISKLGQYTGTGSSGNAITDPGFSPRFLLIKRLDSTSNWNVWDSVRGWSNVMYLNAMDGNQNLSWVSVSASGFSLDTTNVNVNASGGKYLYYAHA